MSVSLTAPLLRATTSTFEELALLFAFPDDALAAAPVHASAAVHFDGPSAGRLALGVSAPVLPAIATNMLGADAAPDAALQRDALGELADDVGGNVVPSLADAAAVFRLRAPESAAGDAAMQAGAGETMVGEVRLTLDEGSAIARLFVRDVGSP